MPPPTPVLVLPPTPVLVVSPPAPVVALVVVLPPLPVVPPVDTTLLPQPIAAATRLVSATKALCVVIM
jgi:hypothetical protein